MLIFDRGTNLRFSYIIPNIEDLMSSKTHHEAETMLTVWKCVVL